VDIHNVLLGTIACSVAGIAAWMILISFRDLGRCIPSSALNPRLEMPPAEKEVLREKVINRIVEERGGYWSHQWDRPTGNRP